MKLTLNGWEIEVKAKSQFKDRANKQDTMYFLNDLACYALEAKQRYKDLGLYGLAEEAQEFQMGIHDALDKAKFYK